MKRDTSDVRAEIAAAGGDRPMIIQATPAAAAWAQPRPTRDPGIPGWAFLCAAMLAVGAVIAWGNRRSSDLGE